jgi:hypothetical protein
VHPNLIAALAEDRRRSWPCGAVTEQPYRPYRQCLAWLVWRWHTSRSPRSAVRRPAHRQTPARAWIFVAATFMFRVISREARI